MSGISGSGTTDDIEQLGPTDGVQPLSKSPNYTGRTRMDLIKRITAPKTMDGSRWEVGLSAVPSPAWLEFFKQSGEAPSFSASPRPQRVTFDRASVVFKSDEDHVEQWIEAIDEWIAAAEARYVMSLDEASRQRALRLDDEAKQREWIQRLNDRFKDL